MSTCDLQIPTATKHSYVFSEQASSMACMPPFYCWSLSFFSLHTITLSLSHCPIYTLQSFRLSCSASDTTSSTSLWDRGFVLIEHL